MGNSFPGGPKPREPFPGDVSNQRTEDQLMLSTRFKRSGGKNGTVGGGQPTPAHPLEVARRAAAARAQPARAGVSPAAQTGPAGAYYRGGRRPEEPGFDPVTTIITAEVIGSALHDSSAESHSSPAACDTPDSSSWDTGSDCSSGMDSGSSGGGDW